MTDPAPDSEMLQFAAKVFNLARHGDTGTLAAYVDAGVPANLCNDKGDTLVMLAAYHGHPHAVSVLLERGADPDRPNDRGQREHQRFGHAEGIPSAVDTARMFGLDDLVARFEGR